MSQASESQAGAVRVGALPWLTTAVVLAAATALGVYADVGQGWPGVLAYAPQLGTPWLLLAFIAGRTWARVPWVGVLLGPLLIGWGLAVYWWYMDAAHGTDLYNLTAGGRGAYWLTLGAVLGAGASTAGVLSRRGSGWLRAAAWGLASAVPLAEAAFILTSSVDTLPPSLAVLPAIAGVAVLVCATRDVPVHRVLIATTAWLVPGVVAAYWVITIL